MKTDTTLNRYRFYFKRKLFEFISETNIIFILNLFKKNNVKKIFLIFFFLIGISETNGQTVSGAAVQANFGIDADIYANHQQFGGITNVSGYDDWFQNYDIYPGSGQGIIDQTNAASLLSQIQNDNNFSFEKRQKLPVRTMVGDFLWTDALYGRDNNSTQSNADATKFAGLSNKNGDNPGTWSLGSGSIPQKNDLIDVFGAIRRDFSPAVVANHPNGELWGFGGSTTISSDGDSHTDFEFFRAAPIGYNGTNLTNLDSDGGHTAWTFDATGNVITPGDILIAVDFSNGGTNPTASVRVWMSNVDIINFNSRVNRTFDLTGVFDQGNGSGIYGYAEIRQLNNIGTLPVYAVVNVENATLASPWGTLEGSQADVNMDFVPLQFTEFGINLTAMGLDKRRTDQGPCSNIIGSFLVKTRSSGSFTAELKDFSGPYLFGNFTEVAVTAMADVTLNCTNPTVTLSVSSVTPSNATLSWYGPSPSLGDEGPLLVGENPTVAFPGIYTVHANSGQAGCFSTDTVTINEDKVVPNVDAGADKELTCVITSIALSGSSTTPNATYSWIASNGGHIVSGANTATPTVDMAGTYTLTVTDPLNGCYASDLVVVTLNNTVPNVDAGADKELTCVITSIALSGSSTTPNATYSWIASNGGHIVSGADSATPTVDMAGTYTLTVTDPLNGCYASDVAVVTLNNTIPNVDAGADKELTCVITSIALSGSSTTPNATYSWIASNGGHIVSGANTATPTVDMAGTYTLTVTDPLNGCYASDVAVVTLNNTVPNVDAGADKELTCVITSIALSGSSTTPNAIYSWMASNGGHIVSGANSATPTVDMAGTYTLTVTDPLNGCYASDVAVVTLNNTTPNVDAGADKELTCVITSIALSGSSTTPNATYSWIASNGGHIVSGADSATPTVDMAGTYTLTVTDPLNGCYASDVAVVTLNNTVPNVDAGADKELTCVITSIALSGSSTTPNATYSWIASNGGHIVSGADSATPTVDMAGTYTLTVTDPLNGCYASDVAVVTLNNTVPNVDAGADKELTCVITSIALSGSSTTPNATYSWIASNGGHIVSGADSATPTVDMAGTYTLTVTDPLNGCYASDVAVVTLNNTVPNVDAGADKELTCVITSIALSGSSTTPNATYSWIASNGGHIVSGADSATPTVDMAGTYTLTVTDPLNGCYASDLAVVTLNNTVPNVDAGADKELTCVITSIALSGSSTTPNATYSWIASNGGHIVSGANTATPTVDMAGTYTLTVTDPLNGCYASDVAVVTLNNTVPNVDAGADKELTCVITSIALSGSSTTPNATYSWIASNGGHIVSGANTATPTVDMAGTYTLTVTDPLNGCYASDVAVVTLNNTVPNVDAGADKELTCVITSIALSGSSTTPNATYSWIASNGGHIVSGANTATPTVDMAGTYTLTVTDPLNGCYASDVAVVTLNNTVPNVDAGADKELTCVITSIALSGSSTTPDATYSWIASNGGHIVSGADSATPTVDMAGTYTLTVTDPLNGCYASDVAVVTLNNTVPNVDAGADKELTCVITSIALSGSSTTPNATYSWIASNGGHIVSGANTATPTVDMAGTYTLTVTDPLNGCYASDVAVVTLNNTVPNVDAGADKELTCVITSIALSGSSTTPNATYSWIASNGGHIVSGANTATPTVDMAGTYTLTVTDPLNGCYASDVAVVTLNNTVPNVDAGADKELTCVITSIALSGSSTTPNATYSWIASNGGHIVSGADSATPTVDMAGTYTLTVTDPLNGCYASDVAVVTLNNTTPNVDAGEDDEIACGNTTIILNATSSTANVTFEWTTSDGNIVSGADSATPIVDKAGTYSVTVTNLSNGCYSSDDVVITLESCITNCTYTQGYYGNVNGTACTLTGETTNALNIMTNAMNSVGGTFDFGSTTTGNYFQLKLSDITSGNIFKMMPGGGTARKLIGFSTYSVFSTWSDNDPLKAFAPNKGKINNVLLSQTITLFFNKQLNPDLSNYVLTPAFATAKTVTCGSNDPIYGTEQVFYIPQQVVNYLSTHGGATVGNLFAYANKALGNESIGTLTVSQINSAVDAINRGFDQCRVVVPLPSAKGEDVTTNIHGEIGMEDKYDVQLYPVPFKNYLLLNYKFETSSPVTIEMFNILGELIFKQVDDNVFLNKELPLNIDFQPLPSEIYLIKVTSDKGTILKRVISKD